MVEQTDEIQAIQTHESVYLVHMKSNNTHDIHLCTVLRS